jgi:hypothetical protein
MPGRRMTPPPWSTVAGGVRLVDFAAGEHPASGREVELDEAEHAADVARLDVVDAHWGARG